jgi:hypothetical protein
VYWCFVICGFSRICTAIFVSWEAALPCCCGLALLLHAQPTAPRSLLFVHCSRAVNSHCEPPFVSLIFQETPLFPFPSERVLNCASCSVENRVFQLLEFAFYVLRFVFLGSLGSGSNRRRLGYSSPNCPISSPVSVRLEVQAEPLVCSHRRLVLFAFLTD